MVTAEHLDIDDPKYSGAAAQILRRHDNFEAEANITSAVRDFLIMTGLAKNDEIQEENPPSDTSRRAVDLTALDTFVEFKRRIGTAAGGEPHPENVRQLDDYLEQSEQQGRVRMGVLTDGKYWLLRWPGAGAVNTAPPYGFTLDSADRWIPLYEWLRDNALEALENKPSDRGSIAEHFGPNCPNYRRDISTLTSLYRQAGAYETVKVKRQLWHDLLRTALGEIARSPAEMDDLFIRHTYLSAVIGMVVQASFGIDIRQLAANEPEDLLYGRRFRNDTGLQGIVESDFFTWLAEVGGRPLLQTLARRIAKFDWQKAPADVGAILYETVIPASERRQLGEYYTPDWLARAMVRELITDPLNQRVLDPACGSGTFIAEAVAHFIETALPENAAPKLHPKEILDKLRDAVTGIDIHPVAVHLARSAWTLAARPAIQAASDAGFYSSLSIPVYLGDALQLRFRTGDMFAQQNVTIRVDNEANTELMFPMALVERAENFDSLMGQVAEAIQVGDDPSFVLDDYGLTDPGEQQTLQQTFATLQRLHDENRDHIWAYYTRNMVRPVALSRAKVDVLIGNPPWINYNQTADVLRDELRNLSRDRYGIWAGGRYATHQDVAGLFFTRSVDLYLKEGGVIGFVMPHSALQTGQYSKWRSGRWESPPTGRGAARSSTFTVSVDFGQKSAWDLEQLEPNDFFPVPACVVFGRSTVTSGVNTPLAGTVERWVGRVGSDDVRRESNAITDTGTVGDSPYAARSRQGATIVPRCLFFVNETENTAIIQAGQTVTVNPRRGGQDKAPWKDLDLTAIHSQTVEETHLFDVHLGETVAPYVNLEPLKALLPLKQGTHAIPTDEAGPGGIGLGGLEQRMRGRWQTVSRMWEDNKASANKLNLLGRLDYHGELSSQLEWQKEPGERPVRVIYTSSGTPTASLVQDDKTLVDYTLFWMNCKDKEEANYLLAIINSDALYESVQPLMAKGQFGARHLQKHLWKLPIPEYDPKQKLHVVIAKAGERAVAGAADKLAQVRQERGSKFTVRIARQKLRAWLRSSPEGKEVEAAVKALLGQGVDYRGTITIEADKRFGKPCIRGIRMTVQDVMEYLAGGETWADLLDDFDNLTEEDLHVCLSFAAAEQMDDDYSRLRNAVI